MVEENCAFLSAAENIAFTRENKYRAMEYLVEKYGHEKIDKWLVEIGWKERSEEIMNRVRNW